MADYLGDLRGVESVVWGLVYARRIENADAELASMEADAAIEALRDARQRRLIDRTAAEVLR